jgi:23S rRNA pseudouridine2457 synthase
MPTLVFFKPCGVVSHFTDPTGAPTLADCVSIPGVYAAGRLDKDSEGLLILTDDGSLAARITDPARHLEKTYYVQVERVPDEAALTRLRHGVILKGYQTRPARVELLPDEPDLPPRSVPIRVRLHVPTAWLRMRIHEGRNRQIRHMTAAVGYPTLRLVRVAIGPLTLAGLQPGQWRILEASETRALMQSSAK